MPTTTSPKTTRPAPNRPPALPPILVCAYEGEGTGGSLTLEALYTVDPKTNTLAPLLVEPDRSNVGPAWSPDRARIALNTSDPHGGRLRVVETATGQEVYAFHRGWEPRWIDDTTMLFLDSVGVEEPTGSTVIEEVVAMDMRNGSIAQVTQVSPALVPSFVDWHPTRGLVLNVRPRGAHPWTVEEIAVVTPAVVLRAIDGSGPRVRPADLRYQRPFGRGWACVQPRWSPTGDRLVFLRQPANRPTPRDIAVLDVRKGVATILLDGTTVLPEGPMRPGEVTDDAGPVFSPDGRSIAWNHGFRNHWRELWVMDADGTDKRQVTDLGRMWMICSVDW